MSPLIQKTLIVSGAALSCAAAFAAGTLNARVLSVEGDRVSLQTSGPAPAWLSPGASVQALGWTSKVVSVQDGKLVLLLSASRTAQVKADSAVVVREIPTQEKYGC